MEKVITMKELNEAIELACECGRAEYGWTDEDCARFAANLMEKFTKQGYKAVKEND